MKTELSRRNLLHQAAGLAATAPVVGLTACDLDDLRPATTVIAGATMGTGYAVKIAGLPSGIGAGALRARIERALLDVNVKMSTWRADSELSRFNAGESAEWTAVSPELAAVVGAAVRIGHLSGGAFDPTIGPLVDLWGFGAGSSGRRVPPGARIEAALAGTGFRRVRARAWPPAIAKDGAALRVDLSGIAKGFGVDRLAALLDGYGIRNYLVEIGGELRARGHSARGRPWRIGIERPAAGARTIQRIAGLDAGAIATSGDYRNFFERGGARYSHIIDPRTGKPVTHRLASVTVIAATTMRADALSTALMVLGPDAGIGLARRAKLAALFIVRDGTRLVEVATPGFERYRPG